MNLIRRVIRNITEKPKIRIAAYRSYGTRNHLYLLGRALDDDELNIREEQSLLYTLRNTYKQFNTDEIGGAEVLLQLPNGVALSAKTNAEGYFLFDKTTSIDLKAHADPEGWLPLIVKFLQPVPNAVISSENTFDAELLIPPISAEFGVISDIDDTILHTGVTSFLKWRVVKNSLFRNAYDRLSLEGSPQFYRALHLGKRGFGRNPIFYLSNSAWNLYEYLKLFLEINNFPKGPILLRDFRTPFDRTL